MKASVLPWLNPLLSKAVQWGATFDNELYCILAFCYAVQVSMSLINSEILSSHGISASQEESLCEKEFLRIGLSFWTHHSPGCPGHQDQVSTLDAHTAASIGNLDFIQAWGIFSNEQWGRLNIIWWYDESSNFYSYETKANICQTSDIMVWKKERSLRSANIVSISV